MYPESGEADPGFGHLWTSFNQNCTALAVGSRAGIQLYNLERADKLELVHESGNEQDVLIIERLFCSSLIAVVSASAPCRLRICHFKKGKEICSNNYPTAVLSVRLNRQHLVVCLAERLYVHSIRNMKILHIIQDTPVNSAGVCALSSGDWESYLAYPGSTQAGVVQVYDAQKLCSLITVDAHTSPIAAAALGLSGSRMATASEKGTVIRVFSLPDGAKLFDFRRGLKRYVTVSSLAFSSDGVYVAASSNTETVHVFKLQMSNDKAPADEVPSSSPVAIAHGWANYVTQALLKTSVTYLPTQVADVIGPSRAFATARLPTADRKTICGIASIHKMPHVVVTTDDGYLYTYSIDTNTGGECTSVKQHRIAGSSSALAPSGAAEASLAPSAGSGAIPISSPTRVGSQCLAGATSSPSTDIVDSTAASEGDTGNSLSCRGDASYAYKLKKAPRPSGPSTVSQELSEIVDNVPGDTVGSVVSSSGNAQSSTLTHNDANGIWNAAQLHLDDLSEFPPVS